jgi:hypothetical protein
MQEFNWPDVYERLHGIERNTAATTEQLKQINRKQTVMSEHLTGNGDYKKGLLHRVDRLEFGFGGLRKTFWLVVGATISAVIYFLKDFI